MAGAVNVSIVTFVTLILDVRCRDCQNLRGVTTSLRLGCFCNLVVGDVVCKTLEVLHVGDRRCKRRFTMVNVTDCAYVNVRLLSKKFFFGHLVSSF